MKGGETNMDKLVKEFILDHLDFYLETMKDSWLETDSQETRDKEEHPFLLAIEQMEKVPVKD